MSDAEAVRARYVEAMTRRMQTAPGAVQRLLQARLERFPVRPEPVEGPSTKKPLSPLVQLNRHISKAIPANSELKSLQAFRETWSRIRAEEEVIEAVQRGPENAGPLNSHMLVLRTLGLMRELSPDYLRRFMAHADALLWLDQASARPKPAVGKGRAVRQKK